MQQKTSHAGDGSRNNVKVKQLDYQSATTPNPEVKAATTAQDVKCSNAIPLEAKSYE